MARRVGELAICVWSAGDTMGLDHKSRCDCESCVINTNEALLRLVIERSRLYGIDARMALEEALEGYEGENSDQPAPNAPTTFRRQ